MRRLRSSGVWARCHSDEPIADQVVSIPATSSRTIEPPTMSSESFSPSSLHVHQVAREVVTRVLAVVFDLGADVLAEFVDPVRVPGSSAMRLQRQSCTNVTEQGFVLLGESEHPTDDVDRDVLCVLDRSIDDGLAGSDLTHVVEQTAAQNAHLVLPRLDLLGSERRQQHAASHAVEGRITRDRRHRTDGRWHRHVTGTTDRHDDRAAREVVGVVRDVVHGIVGDRNPHAAVAVGVSDRAAVVAQLLPDLGGVRVVVLVGVVEIGREVGDRAVVVGVVGHALPARRCLRVSRRRWCRESELRDRCLAALRAGRPSSSGVVDDVGHVDLLNLR